MGNKGMKALRESGGTGRGGPGHLVDESGLPYGAGCKRWPDCFTCPDRPNCKASCSDIKIGWQGQGLIAKSKKGE